jgi:hypothetical protein
LAIAAVIDSGIPVRANKVFNSITRALRRLCEIYAFRNEFVGAGSEREAKLRG